MKTEPVNLARLRGSGARLVSFINAPRDLQLQSGLPLAAHETLWPSPTHHPHHTRTLPLPFLLRQLGVFSGGNPRDSDLEGHGQSPERAGASASPALSNDFLLLLQPHVGAAVGSVPVLGGPSCTGRPQASHSRSHRSPAPSRPVLSPPTDENNQCPLSEDPLHVDCRQGLSN